MRSPAYITLRRACLLLGIIAAIASGLWSLTTISAQASETHQVLDTQASSGASSTAPVLDLNGPAPGRDYAATFTEDDGPRLIVDAGLTVSDTDSTTMRSAIIRLLDTPNGNAEILSADVAGTGISASYDASRGELRLQATDTITNYQAALRSVAYENRSDAPVTLEDRTVSFRIYDGTSYSEDVFSVIAINAVNDAPKLDNSGEMRFAPVDEDDVGQIGNSVGTLIQSAEEGGADRITDPDPDAVEGIAVIEAGNSNGTWEYSLDAGSTWLAFGAVANKTAVLLNTAARIRFLPIANYSGQASISLRAWDQTQGTNGATGVDVSINGGNTAFSEQTETATLEVRPVNDLPVVDLNGHNPGTNFATSYVSGSGAISLASPDTTVTDVDNSLIVSATVRLGPLADPSSEQLGADISGTAIGELSYDATAGVLHMAGAAPLSDYAQTLRTLTYRNTAAFTTTGTRQIEILVSDGLASSRPALATVTLIPYNSAPILDPQARMTLDDIHEDELEPPGNTVAEIIASAASPPISDADPGAVAGFAIVGARNEQGSWQYRLAGADNWQEVGEVTETAALLLDAEARIRFAPEADFSGATRSITIRAWDQTSGSNGRRGVDVSSSGGLTAYSATSAPVEVMVVPVNDAPILEIGGGIAPIYIEDGEPVVVTGPAFEVTDIDSAQLQEAKVRIVDHVATEADILATLYTAPGVATTFDPQRGILTLSGMAPVADYQALLRTITFQNRSQDPDGRARTIRITVSDSISMSNTVSGTIQVIPVNDSPQVDLNGRDMSGTGTRAFYNDATGSGRPVLVAPSVEIQDPDNTSLSAATVTLLNRPDGQSERLAIDTSGTNIGAKFRIAEGRLELLGADTVANYERVLRTVTYNNLLPSAHRASRRVEIVAHDRLGSGEGAISTVTILPSYAFFPVVGLQTQTESPVDEPNNSCQDAYTLTGNQEQTFEANDRDDWYRFELQSPATVIVELHDFVPEEGQLLLASGSCTALKRIGHNGDYSRTKIIAAGTLPAGNYYIWLINDGRQAEDQLYRLLVRVE